jgi:AraC-like DNA-binding protein
VSIQQHRYIVARILDIARAHLDGSLQFPDFCRIASVSEYSVRNAFRHVYGATPCRYLRERRMQEARKALLAADGDDVTVTDVAMRFGFFEVGRFAVNYRLTFGENPSITLRRSPYASFLAPIERARSEDPSADDAPTEAAYPAKIRIATAATTP